MIRRDFFKYSILTAATATTLTAKENINKNIKKIKTKIAICGAGFAGLSCAKHLKELDKNLDVTLIEKRDNFTSCPFSNLWLGDVDNISYENLNYEYNYAIDKFGYNFLNSTIENIDINTKTIKTNNECIEYEYLIMAVGIDYDYTKLIKNEKKARQCSIKTPAGLKPGSEHLALKRMVKNFKGGNFVISVPSGTYRCPPAPYERACMIASYFEKNRIDGKVIILDPRIEPAAKAKRFLEAFEKFHKDTIEYRPLTNFYDIDFEKKEIITESFNKKILDYETIHIKYEEANIIPPNKANHLLTKAGIETYDTGWAKLKRPTFRSVSHDDVYIIGDSQGEYPYAKSAQMANSCAYVVAQELYNRINKKVFDYKKNLPGNICYSTVAPNQAVSISHIYEYKDKMETTTMISQIDSFTAGASKGWFFGLIDDILAIKS